MRACFTLFRIALIERSKFRAMAVLVLSLVSNSRTVSALNPVLNCRLDLLLMTTPMAIKPPHLRCQNNWDKSINYIFKTRIKL
jgi:hypothetical protein